MKWMLVSCLLFGCQNILFEDEVTSDPQANFEQLWSTFNQKYGTFEVREVDWDQIYRNFRPRVSESTNNRELYAISTEMLAELDDPHVLFLAQGFGSFNSGKNYREREGYDLFNLNMIRAEYLKNTRTIGQVTTGEIGDDIAYVHISSLLDPIEGLDQVMEFIYNRPKLIIDLRHNGGGNFHHGFELVNQLVSEEKLAFSTVTKTGPDKDDFGPEVQWITKPKNSGYMGKVVVLIDKFTHSAAERTLFGLMTLPDVTLIGENSSGGHGEIIFTELPNGWTYTYVPQIVYGPDGKSHEKDGIEPDIFIINNQEDIFQRVDKPIQGAIDLLL